MSVSPRGTAFQASFRHKGERYRRQFPTRLEAQQWEADSYAKLLHHQPIELGEQAAQTSARKAGKPYTMGELRDWIIATRWGAHRSLKTHKINAAACVDFIGKDTPITHVDKLTVGKMVAKWGEEGDALSTMNRKLSAFNVMMTEAVELEIIDKAPKQKLFKESEGRIRRFTPDEEKLVLGYFALARDQDMEDFVALCLDTGLRREEVLLLDDHATIDADYVKVFGTHAKGFRNRAVPSTQRAAGIIRRRTAGGTKRGLLFPDLGKEELARRWNRVRAEMRLSDDANFVPHILRHEFCSRLADIGIPVQVIQQLAGHKDIKTTMRYIHLSPNSLRAAIEALESRKLTLVA